MNGKLKILLAVTLVVGISALLLMFDVPPPPDGVQAQRRGEAPYFEHFSVRYWGTGIDGDQEALEHKTKYWRLGVKCGSNAADSVQVKIKNTYEDEWETLSFPGSNILPAFICLEFYGPEIDSIEVFTGTASTCARIECWW